MLFTVVAIRAKTMEEQIGQFWKSADFGYVKQRLDELTVFCKPENPVSFNFLSQSFDVFETSV